MKISHTNKHASVCWRYKFLRKIYRLIPKIYEITRNENSRRIGVLPYVAEVRTAIFKTVSPIFLNPISPISFTMVYVVPIALLYTARSKWPFLHKA